MWRLGCLSFRRRRIRVAMRLCICQLKKGIETMKPNKLNVALAAACGLEIKRLQSFTLQVMPKEQPIVHATYVLDDASALSSSGITSTAYSDSTTVAGATGTGITIGIGLSAFVECDGTNVLRCTADV